MAVCFICNAKLYGKRTRVCSSITPHSHAPYVEKIGELVGEEFVIIVTPADHMCKKCNSLVIYMDKLQNDLKDIKNAILSNVQKKYGMLPADQPIASIEVVNENIKTDDLETVQRRVPSGLTVREPSTSAGGSNAPTRTRQDPSKIKIYKCEFCPLQSKDLGHIRFHMRSHIEKKDNEKSNQPLNKTQEQKKKLYTICQVCSLSFDSKLNYLDHIQRNHNEQPKSTTEEQETDVTLEETASVSTT